MSLCNTWHLLPTDKACLREFLIYVIGFRGVQAQTHTGLASSAVFVCALTGGPSPMM